MSNHSISQYDCQAIDSAPINDQELTELLLWYLASPNPNLEVLVPDTIYRQTKGIMYRIAYRFLNNHELAQDAVQDVTIHLIRKLKTPEFSIYKSCIGWIAQEVKWYCLDYFKKKRLNQVQFAEVEDYLQSDNNNQPDQGLDRDMIMDCKDQALSGKRKQMRKYIIDAHLQGYLNPEIAKQLEELTGKKITEKVVRQILSHARKDVEKGLRGTGYYRPKKK